MSRWAGQEPGSRINLLGVRTVIVGGGVSQAGSFILEAVLRHIKPGMRRGVTSLQETLATEVGTLGAAYLVFKHAESYAFASVGS